MTDNKHKATLDFNSLAKNTKGTMSVIDKKLQIKHYHF